jgi:hypothetical protein
MLALVAIGLGSAVLYAAWVAWVPLLPNNLYEPLLDLGKITEYTWPSALRYLFLVGSLNLLYALGYRYVRYVRSCRVVFVFGLVFCLELVWTYPATAADVFGYVAHGHVLGLHGANPFVVPPSMYPRDPIVPYLAFPDEPSQYGPLWVVLNAAIALAAGGDLVAEVLLYKVLAAAAHLAGGALVLLAACRLGAPNRQALAGAYLFLWNPLLLWEMVGNAHNDGLMLLGGLVGVWLLARGSDRLVLPALAAGALVKLPILVAAPVLVIVTWRRGRAAAIQGVLLAAMLVVLCYLPFWHGPETLTGLARTGEDLFTASPASVLRQILDPLLGGDLATLVARAFAYGSFGVVLGLILVRAWRTRDARTAARLCYATVLAALLLAITWFQAWYVVWPFGFGAALACGARHREVALLALGGLLQYFVFVYLWVMGVVPDEAVLVQSTAYAALIGPLALGSLMVRARSRWPSRRPRPPRPRRGPIVRAMSG